MYLDKTRQQACNNRRTLCSANYDICNGSPRDRITAVANVGSGPALVTCRTSQVLLAGVPDGFPGVLSFRPTYRLARLDMSEMILKGT